MRSLTSHPASIRLGLVFVTAALSVAFSASALAKGSDVSFRGTVDSVTQTSDTEATVTIRLQNFNVEVLVNGDTEIESDGDDVGLAGLTAGTYIKISGFFSTDGITAEEIDILDTNEGQFRLRGLITAAGPVTGGTLITLLGVDVLVNDDTVIERRGSDVEITADELVAGMMADAAGLFDDPDLIATRLKIGDRESDAVKVEFEGTIDSISDTMLTVDTDGGGSAVVLLTDSTRIIGELVLGTFVEVRGTLNEDLAVVDAVIKVDEDGDGDADDDHGGDDDDHGPRDRGHEDDGRGLMRRSTRLEAADDVSLEGEVQTEFLETPSGQGTQELEVSFHGAERRAEFQVRVTFASGAVVDFGIVEANGGGRVKVKFRSNGGGQTPNVLGLLPDGETVKDIQRVEILDDEGNVLMTATFA